MNFNDWMDETNANAKGLAAEERIRRLEYRERIAAAAGTTIGTLRNARCRGRIGADLLSRLATATAGTEWPVDAED